MYLYYEKHQFFCKRLKIKIVKNELAKMQRLDFALGCSTTEK